jgi:hypothetical protein
MPTWKPWASSKWPFLAAGSRVSPERKCSCGAGSASWSRRTGSEGRISYLKRDWEWGRSRMDGERGARTWCGWGILASNSVTISGLVATKTTTHQPSPHHSGRPDPPSAAHHRHVEAPHDPRPFDSPGAPGRPATAKRAGWKTPKGRGQNHTAQNRSITAARVPAIGRLFREQAASDGIRVRSLEPRDRDVVDRSCRTISM